MPRPFGRRIVGHAVSHTSRHGWEELSNGELLRAARAEGFEVMLTVDQHIAEQQSELPIPVVVLIAPMNTEEDLAPLLPAIHSLLGQRLQPRVYVLP